MAEKKKKDEKPAHPRRAGRSSAPSATAHIAAALAGGAAGGAAQYVAVRKMHANATMMAVATTAAGGVAAAKTKGLTRSFCLGIAVSGPTVGTVLALTSHDAKKAEEEAKKKAAEDAANTPADKPAVDGSAEAAIGDDKQSNFDPYADEQLEQKVISLADARANRRPAVEERAAPLDRPQQPNTDWISPPSRNRAAY